MAELVYTQGFVEDVAGLHSAKDRSYVMDAVEALAMFPEMGSAVVARSIRSRYGAHVRKLTARPVVVVYEYDEEREEVVLFGAYPQRLVV